MPTTTPHIAIVMNGARTVEDVKASGFAFTLSKRDDHATNPGPEDSVELVVVNSSKITQRAILEAPVWEALIRDGDLNSIKSDVGRGALLVFALKGELEIFENEYSHDGCGSRWSDTWSCGCDDQCPKCGTSISPVESTPLRTLEEVKDGVWAFSEGPDLDLKITALAEVSSHAQKHRRP